MERDELAVRIAAALNVAPSGFPAYAQDNPGDARGTCVEVVTGHDERWTLWLERGP